MAIVRSAVPGAFEQSHGSVAAHHDGLEHRHGKVAIDDALLREVTDLGPVVAAQLIAGAIKNMEMSFERSHQPEDRPAERGLSRSVGTDHSDELAGVDRQVEISLSAMTPGKPNEA